MNLLRGAPDRPTGSGPSPAAAPDPRPGTGAAGALAPPRYEDVWSFRPLLDAFHRARAAKRGRGGEPAFYHDLDGSLRRLSAALRERTWRPEPYRFFVLRRAKERLVSEAAFPDRVVHHALVRALEPAFEARFIADSYACRRGKGAHAAVERAQTLARRTRYFAKLDIRRYFDGVDHRILLSLLAEAVQDDGLLWLCGRILEGAALPHLPAAEGRGIPIGNLSSQFWANVYLDPLDHLVTRELGVRSYVRYMDDLLLLGGDKAHLWRAVAAVRRFLAERLRLTVKDEATVLAPVTEGIPWLGFRVFPGMVRLDRATRRRLAGKLATSMRRAALGVDEEAAEQPRASSLCAHVGRASARELRRSLVGSASNGGLP